MSNVPGWAGMAGSPPPAGEVDPAAVPPAAAQPSEAAIEAAGRAYVAGDSLYNALRAAYAVDFPPAAAQPSAEERSPTEGTSIISDTWNDGFSHGVQAERDRAAAAQPPAEDGMPPDSPFIRSTPLDQAWRQGWWSCHMAAKVAAAAQPGERERLADVAHRVANWMHAVAPLTPRPADVYALEAELRAATPDKGEG